MKKVCEIALHAIGFRSILSPPQTLKRLAQKFEHLGGSAERTSSASPTHVG